jgi:hypothetical protein
MFDGTRPMILALTALVLLALPAAARAQDEWDPGTPVIVLVEDSAAYGGPIAGYRCGNLDNPCPANTVVLDPSTGNVKGCKRHGAVCLGSCTACNGSQYIVALCVRDPTKTCIIGVNNTGVNCGKKKPGVCYLATTGGDPNGCWCGTLGAATGDDCFVLNCI